MLPKVLDPRVWPSRLAARYLTVTLVCVFLLVNSVLWHHTNAWGVRTLRYPEEHPITKLTRDAQARHQEKLSRRSLSLKEAASRYRAARGRHPPPGFEHWFQAALDADAVIVEDYFDRIYKDVAPFWGIDANVVKERAHSWPWVVRVRNSTAFGDGDTEGRVPWLQLWTALVDEFAGFLPEVDMPINYMDEPRLLVPHSVISKLVGTERAERSLAPPDRIMNQFRGLAHLDEQKPGMYDPHWWGPDNAYWNLAVKTCDPRSPAHGVEAVADFSVPVEFPRNYNPEYAFQGFVSNWTAAMDPCGQPHLRQLHSTFVEPISLSSTNELIPLFGGSKLPMNNEILIPGAMYLTDDEFYSGGDDHGPPWDQKRDGIVWRGDASGGRFKPENWHHSHRHRLVDMLNSTTVSRAEHGNGRSRTFELPDTNIYNSPRTTNRTLGAWIQQLADVGFVNLCVPGQCDYMEAFFHPVERKPMREQYDYKFLPDADGNSFSARFRGFMRSTSAPLKATIYAEWHDDRLVPWVHFIPLDNTFRELYPVLEYFTNDTKGDDAARLIAESGELWSAQVLRREDMRLYVWRLLLEWARVCDEDRHSLGFVEDLI